MIISERLGIAFIHIPKCAGTTVRGALEKYDESYERMIADLKPHPDKPFTYSADGGETFLDMHHLTLEALQTHFPAELDRLRHLRVFALVRDPHERLLSAVLQRLKQFQKVAVEDLSRSELRNALQEHLSRLGKLFQFGDQLPFDFIHFQPQHHFIELADEVIADDVFALSDLSSFEAAVIAHAQSRGETIPSFATARDNVARTHRFASVAQLVQKNGWLKKVAKAIVPQPIKGMVRSIFYRERRDEAPDPATHEQIKAFVQSHYSRDVELFHQAKMKARSAC